MTTRRGPDVARGPDVVHHCITGYNNISWRSHDRPAPPKIWGSRPLNPRGLPPMTIRFVVAYFNGICLRSLTFRCAFQLDRLSRQRLDNQFTAERDAVMNPRCDMTQDHIWQMANYIVYSNHITTFAMLRHLLVSNDLSTNDFKRDGRQKISLRPFI